jgi:hypothetical protein
MLTIDRRVGCLFLCDHFREPALQGFTGGRNVCHDLIHQIAVSDFGLVVKFG